MVFSAPLDAIVREIPMHSMFSAESLALVSVKPKAGLVVCVSVPAKKLLCVDIRAVSTHVSTLLIAVTLYGRSKAGGR